MIGGFAREGTGLASVERFDAQRRRFVPFADMTRERIQPLAHTLADGRVLVMGGEWREEFSSAEVWEDRRFRFLGRMTGRRTAAASAVLADGSVLICGGQDADGRMLRTAERFDPASGRFETLPEMREARAGHTATRLRDGRILIAGGGTEQTVMASAEIFEPAKGRFRPVGRMSQVRFKHGAALLSDGSVLVAGGGDPLSARDRRGRLATCEVFDVSREVFLTGPSLVDPRYKLSPSTVVLKSGAVVVASGGSHPEVLRAGADAFELLPVTYDTRRDYMAAVAVDADSVLITGGYDSAIQATADAWLARI